MSQIRDTSTSHPPTLEKYKVYPYRYVTAVIFSFAAMQNVLLWLVFGPLQTTLPSMYDTSLTVVSLGTILIANICYIPANFIATSILDTYGLRVGTILGSVLTLIGLWIRYFCEHSFAFIFVGQFFGGMAQPFFYSTPQKISSIWFSSKERTMATTCISISLNIGNALGAFLPQFFIDLDETDNGILMHQMRTMLLWLAIIGTISTVITIIFFKEKPPTPPSKAAKAEKYNYIQSLIALIKDKNAMLFLVASAASSGAMFTYGTVIQQLVYNYGITPVQVGNILFIGIIIGFFGSASAGYYVYKTKQFKMSIIVLCSVSFLALFANYFAARSGHAYLFGACYCIYNTFVTPIMPLSFEASVELSFPVAEAASGGLWFTLNLAFSTGESFAIDALLEDHPDSGPLISYIIMAVYQLIFLVLLFFVRENLKRTQFEKESLLGGHAAREGAEREHLLSKALMSSVGGAMMMFDHTVE